MFALRASDIRGAGDYAAAVTWYEKTAVSSNGMRYISTNKNLTIRKANEAIICSYCLTDVVTFKPDGSIVLDTGGWDTPSTIAFIERCCRIPFYLRLGKVYARLQGGHYLVRPRLTVMDGWPVEPVQEYVMVLNKELAKEARKPLASFMKRLRAFASVSPMTRELHKAYGDKWSELYQDRAAVIACILDESRNEIAIHYFMWVSGDGIFFIDGTVVGDQKKQLDAEIRKVYEHLYSPACYERTPVPLGTVCTSRTYT